MEEKAENFPLKKGSEILHLEKNEKSDFFSFIPYANADGKAGF